MTEKDKDETAKASADSEKGHTMGDAALTAYRDLKESETAQAASETTLAIAKAVGAVIVPIGGALVWSSEKVVKFVKEGLGEKLKNTPPENIQQPNPAVAGDILQALQFRIDEEFLRNMFLNLLAASMDKTRAGNALPAFVEVIRQLSPDEALILRRIAEMNLFVFPLVDICATGFDYRGTGDLGAHGGYQPVLRDHANLVSLAGCKYEENESVYIANMSRLGLFEVDNRTIPADAEEIYEALSNDPVTAPIKREIVEKGQRVHIIKKSGQFTEFGKAFCKHAIGEFPAKDTTR